MSIVRVWLVVFRGLWFAWMGLFDGWFGGWFDLMVFGCLVSLLVDLVFIWLLMYWFVCCY